MKTRTANGTPRQLRRLEILRRCRSADLSLSADDKTLFVDSFMDGDPCHDVADPTTKQIYANRSANS